MFCFLTSWGDLVLFPTYILTLEEFNTASKPVPNHLWNKLQYSYPSFLSAFIVKVYLSTNQKNRWEEEPNLVGLSAHGWRTAGRPGAVLTGREVRPGTHREMRCTCSRCLWRGKGRLWFSCWTCPGRPSKELCLPPCWCRFLPALDPCEAEQDVHMIADKRRLGMWQERASGEKILGCIF